MSEDRKRTVIPAKGGFFDDLWTNMRLIVRLLTDNRINPFLKLLPIGSLVYLVFPLDIPGPIDDAIVVTMAMYLFLELCPQDVVEEHRQAIRGVFTTNVPKNNPGDPGYKQEDVIEAEFREK
jgi:uncharacterized membrane protein YkvA (DUF1232 family)